MTDDKPAMTSIQLGDGTKVMVAGDAKYPITHGLSLKEIGVPFTVIPEGAKIEDLASLLPPPKDRRAMVSTVTVDSFIAYINDFKTDASRIFCAETYRKPVGRTEPPIEDGIEIRGYIDYHKPPGKKMDGGVTGWGRHRVSFTPEHSPEWKLWTGINSQKMSKDEFALFIEDNVVDIIDPPAGDMLNLAMTFEATKSVRFKDSHRLSDGQRNLEYQEEIDGGAGPKGEIKIPTEFTISIPIFKGEEPVSLVARFRFRLGSGSLNIWYELVQPQTAIDAAVKLMIEKVKQKTGKPVFMGEVDFPAISDI